MNITKFVRPSVASLALLCAVLHAEAQTTEIRSFTNLNKAIPDGSSSGLSDVRNLSSEIVVLTAVRLKLSITGQFNGDLYAYVRHISPGHTNFCVLLNRVGRSSTNSAGYADAGFDITFDDAATNGDIHVYRDVAPPASGVPLTSSWQPDGRNVDPSIVLTTNARTTTLNSFTNVIGSGEWTIFLADLESGGTNMLASWELQLTGVSTPALTWATPGDITYGTALSSTQLNASSPVPGTFTYLPAAGSVLNAGSNQTLSVTFTPSDTNSYSVLTNNVTIQVQKSPLLITAVSTNKVFGAALPILTADYNGFVNGDTAASLTAPAGLTTSGTASSPVGSYPITASGASGSNYIMVYASGSLTVTPAALTITAMNTNKVYGAAMPALTATYSGFVNGDTTTSLTAPASLTTSATASSPAGTYAITAGGASGSNYTFAYVTGTLTVSPASLTITAVSTNKVYGAPLPVFTATYAGFVNGDVPGSLSTAVNLTTTASAASPVATYAITPSGASSSNYSIAYVSGTLTVTRASTIGIFSSSANPSLPGQLVVFTLTVSAVAPGAGTPGGNTQFKLDGTNAGSPVALSSGTAAASISTLSLGTHTVSAEYPGDGNFIGVTNVLAPVQLVNTPPVAGVDTIYRRPTSGVKVSVADLLTNTSDADGDPVTLVSVSATSSNAGTVVRNGDWIFYTPPAGYTNVDSFTYTISDGRGAPVMGTVVVSVTQDQVPSPNLVVSNLGNGTYLIRFDGIPGETYRIEYTEDVSHPTWQALGAATADQFGMFQFADTPPNGAPQRFYRSIWP